MFDGQVANAFNLHGRLWPQAACQRLHYIYGTQRRGSRVHIKGDSIEIQFKHGFLADVDFAVRSALANISGILDGQFLTTGQVIQAQIEHPALRRGEGEVIWTSRVNCCHEVLNEQLAIGIPIGAMAELIPPLAHSLRDFRLATILPREDAIAFLWRSLESILWFLADANIKKAEQNIDNAATKLKVKASLFYEVKKQANHTHNFGRHASQKYRDRLLWLKKTLHSETSPFMEKMFPFSEIDNPPDIFPVSFNDEDWKEMWEGVWTIIVRFVALLAPNVRGNLVFPPWTF